MSRLRAILRPLDAKLILALTALIVTVTVCYGFVQRGDHITSAEASVETLTQQVDRLLDENADLHDQLQRIERRSMRRERAAAEDRETLARELVRLTEWLRANGIRIPAASYRADVGASSEPVSSSSGSHGPRSPGPSGHGGGGGGSTAPSSPGNSGGHSQGHGGGGGKGHKGAGVHAGPGGVSIDLP